MSTVVRLDAVTVRLGGRNVLKDVDLEIEEGETTVVFGPSGSGKSTLLAVIGGHLKPQHGSVSYPSAEGASRAAMCGRHRGIPPAWVPQLPLVLPGRTVLDNVLLGPRLGGRRLRQDNQEGAVAALSSVGLGALANRNASVLSGGELQRLAVVRALLAGSRLIIADEPTAALDHTNSMLVMGALRANSTNPAVLIATHDEDVASWCDRVLRLCDGTLTESVVW